MVMGGCKGVWEGVVTLRRCDSPTLKMFYGRLEEHVIA